MFHRVCAIFPTSCPLSQHPPGPNTANVPNNSSQQSFSEPNTSDKIKKAWGVTLSGLETGLWLLAKSADGFPPLKSAVGGLVACLDLAQVGYGCESNSLFILSNSHHR